MNGNRNRRRDRNRTNKFVVNNTDITIFLKHTPRDSLGDLKYTDDIVLYGEDVDKVQSLLNTLRKMQGCGSHPANVICYFRIGLRHLN